MAERVFLHVGTPKSATTYLQYVLWKSARRRMKRRGGVLLPGARTTHFLAAKGVTRRVDQQQKSDMEPDEAWPRLVEQINRWDRDALVCHELFAPATRRQAEQAKAMLQGAEIHVVLTARSLARQVPAAWQQQVKGGATIRYPRFVELLREGDPVRARIRRVEGRARWFWLTQDLEDIAARWGVDIPPERVHIVTLPTDSSDPKLLWRRYSSVFGVDRLRIDSSAPMRNVSLGRAETELLRQINVARDQRFRGPGRQRWTRGLLASNILSDRKGSPIGLPEEAQEWVRTRTDEMLQRVRAAGYDVVGDLDDLRAPAPPAPWEDDVATTDEVAEAGAWTVERLTEHLEKLRQQADDPEALAPPPEVGPDDGVRGILELLEHVRAASTGQRPRPRPTDAPRRGRRRSRAGGQAQQPGQRPQRGQGGQGRRSGKGGQGGKGRGPRAKGGQGGAGRAARQGRDGRPDRSSR